MLLECPVLILSWILVGVTRWETCPAALDSYTQSWDFSSRTALPLLRTVQEDAAVSRQEGSGSGEQGTDLTYILLVRSIGLGDESLGFLAYTPQAAESLSSGEEDGR